MFDTIRSFFTSAPKPRAAAPGAGLSDDDDDRFPAFQQAWKQGATFEDMFGNMPFQLRGSVGGSGADNHRPDVAKVETFLGDAGFYKPMTADGPTGWHNTNLDQGIKAFQNAHGLKVDGLLKPNGPTITKIGGLLGGQSQPQQVTPQAGILPAPGDPDYRPPNGSPAPKPNPGSIWADPQPGSEDGMLTPQQSLEAMIRILGGGQKPPAEPQMPPRLPHPPEPGSEDWKWEKPNTGPTGKPMPGPTPPRVPWPERHDPFPDHTITEEGADDHDRYAQALVKDSDPSKTAAFLKNITDWYGDKGKGDVADLLGRFQKIDPNKALHLQSELHKRTGERIPFRVAPTGGPMADLADGDSDSVRLPTANPWGSAEGADSFDVKGMVDALKGKGDYAGAVQHFAGEFKRDPDWARPYTAAVYEGIAKDSPKQAALFARQMAGAGLVQPAAPSTGSGKIKLTLGKPRPDGEPGSGEVGNGTGGGSSAGTGASSGDDVGDIGRTSDNSGSGGSSSVGVATRPSAPVFDPRYGDKTRPPEWKKDVFAGQPGAWESFNTSVSNLPGVTDTEKFAYGQVYAAEGGNAVDKNSQASSGILPSTLEAAKASGKIPGLEKVGSPKDLNPDQRAAVMKWYFDGALRTVGGSQMLDAVGDKTAAGALADTLYRHGGAGGTRMIQKAINSVNKDASVSEDGRMGPQTFNEFQRLANDPKTRDDLLNKLADLRDIENGGKETDRTGHYRPKR